jgi:hypothetical protein
VYIVDFIGKFYGTLGYAQLEAQSASGCYRTTP